MRKKQESKTQKLTIALLTLIVILALVLIVMMPKQKSPEAPTGKNPKLPSNKNLELPTDNNLPLSSDKNNPQLSRDKNTEAPSDKEVKFSGIVSDVMPGAMIDMSISTMKVGNTTVVWDLGGLTMEGPNISKGRIIGMNPYQENIVGKKVEVFGIGRIGSYVDITSSEKYYVKLLK